MLNDGDGVLITESEPGPSLEACLEAILLVVDEPVAEVVLAQVLERPRDEVSRALAGLASSYDEQRRGYDLRQVAGGWRGSPRRRWRRWRWSPTASRSAGRGSPRFAGSTATRSCAR